MPWSPWRGCSSRASPHCPHAAECFVLMSCRGEKKKKAKSFQRETSQTAGISESIMVMWCFASPSLPYLNVWLWESVMQTACQFGSGSSFGLVWTPSGNVSSWPCLVHLEGGLDKIMYVWVIRLAFDWLKAGKCQVLSTWSSREIKLTDAIWKSCF